MPRQVIYVGISHRNFSETLTLRKCCIRTVLFCDSHRMTIIDLSWRIKRIARKDRQDDGRNSGSTKMVDSDGYESSTVFDKMDSDVHIHHSLRFSQSLFSLLSALEMDIGKIRVMAKEMNAMFFLLYFLLWYMPYCG